ncbi:hypothetical protein JCM8547_009009 [Rhodosporidiobolus lusitaniae]
MAPTRPPPTARLVFKEADEHKVHLEVWLPSAEQVEAAGKTKEEEEGKGVPVVVWCHGGAFFDGAASDCSDVNLLPVLQRGWAFVSPEYRQVPQVTLDDAIQDVKDACEYVRSGGLDRALGGGKVRGEKLAVTGASAGGALAIFASYTLSPPPLCSYSLYGSLDLLHPSYNAPVQFPSGHIPYSQVASHLDPLGPVVSHSPAQVDFGTMVAEGRTRACFWAVQEGKVLPLSTRYQGPIDLENPPEELKKYCATHLVQTAKDPKRDIPPTVCVHGAVDLMVPKDLSRELVEVLKEKAVEAVYIEAEGKNHGFDLIPGTLDNEEDMKVHHAANDFLAKYLDA